MIIKLNFLIYYILMLLCAIIGGVLFKSQKNLQPLIILLPISLITEIIVEFFIYFKINYYLVYHIYEIIDFAFFCLLFYKNTSINNFKKYIVLQFFLFILIIVAITIQYVGLNKFPSQQYAIEGFFLVILSIIFLFTISPSEDVSIFKYNMFWVCLGLTVFHCGILVVNGSYNYLKILSTEKALKFKDTINMTFNYIFYINILIAFKCSKISMK